MSLAISPEGIPAGYAIFEDGLASATELTDTPDDGVALAAGVNSAIVYVSGQPVYWRTDGTAATGSESVIPVGTWLVFENDRTTLVNSSFLESAASGRLDIWWFKSPKG